MTRITVHKKQKMATLSISCNAVPQILNFIANSQIHVANYSAYCCSSSLTITSNRNWHCSVATKHFQNPR